MWDLRAWIPTRHFVIFSFAGSWSSEDRLTPSCFQKTPSACRPLGRKKAPVFWYTWPLWNCVKGNRSKINVHRHWTWAWPSRWHSAIPSITHFLFCPLTLDQGRGGGSAVVRKDNTPRPLDTWRALPVSEWFQVDLINPSLEQRNLGRGGEGWLQFQLSFAYLLGFQGKHLNATSLGISSLRCTPVAETKWQEEPETLWTKPSASLEWTFTWPSISFSKKESLWFFALTP